MKKVTVTKSHALPWNSLLSSIPAFDCPTAIFSMSNSNDILMDELCGLSLTVCLSFERTMGHQ